MATTITGALGDTITGIAGADTLTGGTGDDTYIVNSLLNVIVEPTQAYYGVLSASYGGIDTIQTSVLNPLKTYSLENLPYVENLTYTGTVAAQLKGNATDNVIKANDAAATNDTLYGGDGNDELYGYAGKDLLQGGKGDDVLDGGAGTDADTLIGGTGNDSYLHVSATDIVIETVNSGFDTISTDATGGKYLDLHNFKNVEGLIYNDTVGGVLHGNDVGNLLSSTGDTGNDTINGWAGNDTINGGGGADSLIGGTGDDDLNGGAGTDTLVGGSGDDIYYADAPDVVKELVDGGKDTIIGTKTSIATTEYANTIENLIYTGSTAATVIGNSVDNLIAGGSGNDTVAAGTGNDTVIGGNGKDVVQGGVGDDILYGGSVDNLQTRDFLLHQEHVTPTLMDDNAVDTLIGGSGSDTYAIDNSLDVIREIATDTGVDVIYSTIDNSLTTYSNIEALVLDDEVSNSGAWFAEGDANDNVLIGNNNENYISGGAGNDTLTGDMDGSGMGGAYSSYSYYNNYSPVTDVVDGGDGNDVLLALARENTSSYWNNATQNYVTTTTYASNTNNVLMGGDGDDFYLIQNEKTAIYDSNGTDTVYMMTSGSLESIEGVEHIVLAGGSAADDAIAIAAINKVKLIDGDDSPISTIVNTLAINATGNELDNTIVGNDNNNFLQGLDGNDSLMGGIGNDTLSGGAGTDTLVGGVGDDTYDVDAGDIVTETATGGNDIIRSSTLTTFAGYANIEGLEYTGANGVLLQNGASNTSAERFIGGAGNDTINGWGGNDDLSGGDGNDTINGGDGDDYLKGSAGADKLIGGLGNDTIFGFGESNSTTIDLANTLYGGAGNDQMTGGTGADLMYGEQDNDVLSGGLGADTMDGGAGNDMLSASTNYWDYSDTSANVLTGSAGNDTLYGSAGNDTLSGGTENDYLTGNDGNDSISGDAGADNLNGGNGNDILRGGADNDYLSGGVGNDNLIGDDGNDNLSGDDGNDTLNGSAGNDTIQGGAGDDVVYAGLATASTYAYSTSGDRLTGDWSYNSYQTTGKDLFRFEATAAFAAQSVDADSVWNGTEYVNTTKDMFNTGHFIDDFTKLEDKIQFARAMVGDGDALLENLTVKATAGGTFAQTSEMVIVQSDLTTDFSSSYGGYWSAINASEVVAAIGQADAAFAIGDKRLFVVDDGISSALFRFVSADADATVSATELKLIGVVDGQASLASTDFGLY